MNEWTLLYSDFVPQQEALREALCTLGNGYFATRGAAPEADADEVHYPGTYLAGGYNRLVTIMQGREIENEDLVNFPNWLPFTFRPQGGDWLDLHAMGVTDYRQELHLRTGVLCRRFCCEDAEGRRTRVVQHRLVSMADPHLAALQTTLTPENWSGTLEVRTALEGRVVNAGVKRYRALNSQHLEPLEAWSCAEDTLFLRVRTRQSRIEMAQAARTRIFRDGRTLEPDRVLLAAPGYIGQQLSVPVTAGQHIVVEKIVGVHSSRDHAVSEPGLQAREAVAQAGTYEQLAEAHSLAWSHLWQRFDMELSQEDRRAGTRTSRILRLHVFHLLQTASLNTIDLDVGVPARGLHGEAYRGHIFWDELFIFPLLNLRLPEITRALLRYRYRRLDAARQAARSAGFAGAMFPWQSGSDGREESQVLHVNPRSGRWIPDHTHLQRHVSAAIAYNAWQYFEVTRDTEFLSFYGAEMLLEIARFWASLTTWNASLERYEIKGVMGPDEYHDAYPEAERPGLDNNAYTNVMAVWTIRRALEALELLTRQRRHELREYLRLGDEELQRWHHIAARMRVCFHGEGIISQFEGYDALDEFDWAGYRRRYGDIQRLDRILEQEGLSVNRYKASKQADVLMLFYLLSKRALRELLEGLGYPLDDAAMDRNIDYYMQRTSNGSTLSRVVHAWVLSRTDRVRSWQLFTEALESDIADVQGGTTPEGIHLGAMAGTVDIVQRACMGIETRGDVLYLDPCLPAHLTCLKLNLRYRGYHLDLLVEHGRLRITPYELDNRPIRVGIGGAVHELSDAKHYEFPLSDGESVRRTA